jgi:predicted nucleotidyltransferase
MNLATGVDRTTLVKSLRALQPQLRAKGVIRLAIFGSRARGDHRADSDLDILVDVSPSQKFSLLDLIGVCHTIEDSLGIHTYGVMRQGLDPEMAETIQTDIVEVF